LTLTRSFMLRTHFFAGPRFFFAADTGASGGSKPLKDQLADSEAAVARLTTEKAAILLERDNALSAKATAEQEKAEAEKARDAALGEKETLGKQLDAALIEKGKAETAKSDAEIAKANAQREAEIAKTKGQEDAARAGIKAPANDGAKVQGQKDSGDNSSLPPRQRLAAGMRIEGQA